MKLVIVDPIFRASRLQYSHYVASAFEDFEISIITRVNAVTEQYLELFAGIEHELLEVVDVPDDFWFGKIPRDGLIEIMDMLLALAESSNEMAVYFSGGHEIFPEISDLMLCSKYKVLRQCPMVMIDYEPFFLMNGKYKLRVRNLLSLMRSIFHSRKVAYQKKQTYKKLFSVYPKLRVGILDERVNITSSHEAYFYLPDPVPSDVVLSESCKCEVDDIVTLLIVGTQTERKGFLDVLRFVKQYSHLRSCKLHFVGRLGEEYAGHEEFVRNEPMVDWDEGFFMEDEIRKKYSMCDYVLLPYSLNFNGSSGVLSYSAAFRKPVICTDHGYIGYVVKKYSMGCTYRYGDIGKLCDIVSKLPVPSSEEYIQMQEGCGLYSRSHSLKKHQDVIIRNLLAV